jgi:hypothetical protein
MKDLARMPKKKPPKAKPKLKPKLSQKERFLAYAEENGIDETGEEFERAFDKVVHSKKSD